MRSSLRVFSNLIFCWTSLKVVQADNSCTQNALAAIEESSLVKNGVNLVLHRSGEPEPCGISLWNKDIFLKATEDVECDSNNEINKYEMESLLTSYFKAALEANECGSTDNATAPEGLAGFCDMGPLRTTIQPDHPNLIQQPDGTLPCRFFTREGKRIGSVQDLVELADLAVQNLPDCEKEDQTCQVAPALHLYAVAAGRVFMFAPSFVGEQFVLTHVLGGKGKPVVVETINLQPRLFEIYDFFSKEDARNLIAKSLSESSETHGLHRSRTGATSKSVYHKRTSENAWDTDGHVAMKIKRRCMETLGFDEYWPGHTDGLQILRYQNAQAYVAHHDYLRDEKSKDDPYNYDTANAGGNRFATILLYMTDLGENDGGETLFQEGLRPGFSEMPDDRRAVEMLRSSGDPNLAILEKDSWEESMTAMCRSRLAVQPREGRAVLFYSQFPNGVQDKGVLHGGCPVLNGTKWAANLWVWNAPRTGHPFAPYKEKRTGPLPPGTEIFVTFRNEKGNPLYEKAELWYQDKTNWGTLEPGCNERFTTHKGHVWKIKVDGETVDTIEITGEEEETVHII